MSIGDQLGRPNGPDSISGGGEVEPVAERQDVSDDSPLDSGRLTAGSAPLRPQAAEPGPPQSGLRNPVRAVRGLGAATLAIEAIVLLLAIQPIRLLGGESSGAALAVIIILAVAAFVLAGLLRRAWAWHAGTAVQALLLLSGFLHWSLGVLGVLFGLVWAYVWHVRRAILG